MAGKMSPQATVLAVTTRVWSLVVGQNWFLEVLLSTAQGFHSICSLLLCYANVLLLFSYSRHLFSPSPPVTFLSITLPEQSSSIRAHTCSLSLGYSFLASEWLILLPASGLSLDVIFSPSSSPYLLSLLTFLAALDCLQCLLQCIISTLSPYFCFLFIHLDSIRQYTEDLVCGILRYRISIVSEASCQVLMTDGRQAYGGTPLRYFTLPPFPVFLALNLILIL